MYIFHGNGDPAQSEAVKTSGLLAGFELITSESFAGVLKETFQHKGKIVSLFDNGYMTIRLDGNCKDDCVLVNKLAGFMPISAIEPDNTDI